MYHLILLIDIPFVSFTSVPSSTKQQHNRPKSTSGRNECIISTRSLSTLNLDPPDPSTLHRSAHQARHPLYGDEPIYHLGCTRILLDRKRGKRSRSVDSVVVYLSRRCRMELTGSLRPTDVSARKMISHQGHFRGEGCQADETQG